MIIPRRGFINKLIRIADLIRLNLFKITDVRRVNHFIKKEWFFNFNSK